MRNEQDIAAKIQDFYKERKTMMRGDWDGEGLSIIESSIRALKWVLGDDNPEV